MSRSWVSRRAVMLAGLAVLFHLLAWWWVASRNITYDWGGFEGLLWWLVAFLVLPMIGLLAVLASAAKRAFGIGQCWEE